MTVARIVLVATLLAWTGTEAQIPRRHDVPLPVAARPFVSPDTRPIVFRTADLNRDGRQDAVLVLENTRPRTDDDDLDEFERTLVVLVGQPDGSYREAARNTRVVYCSRCGSQGSDPFDGVSVGRGTFTVANGSNFGSGQWNIQFWFHYSRRDKTWQLVKVEEMTSDPTRLEHEPAIEVSKPPNAFGKIDFADFDPESWRGQGRR